MKRSDFNRILVATDGTKAAQAALELAASLARTPVLVAERSRS